MSDDPVMSRLLTESTDTNPVQQDELAGYLYRPLADFDWPHEPDPDFRFDFAEEHLAADLGLEDFTSLREHVHCFYLDEQTPVIVAPYTMIKALL